MLDTKGLEKLYQILNARDHSLEQIQSQFLSKFNDSLSVFKASYALSNLLNLNYEGIKKHPFGATILHISSITSEAFERKMIADMIIDMKRQKYSKMKIDALYEEEQSILDPIEERPELKKIREEFIANLPKISQSKKSAVKNVIPDFNEKDKKLYPPETQPQLNTIKQADISNESFNIEFMRPIPKFIDIHPSELNWLSPGIITDVHWDNSAQIEKKLAKVKTLIKKSLTQRIQKQECLEFEHSLETEPYAVLNLGVTPEMLMQIVKNNSYIAVIFMSKLSNYPIIGDYFETFLEKPLTVNTIDVISRLHKIVKIPQDFTLSYALLMLKDIKQRAQNDKEKSKIVKLTSMFIKALTKNAMLDFKNHLDDLEDFLNTYIHFDEVANLKKFLQGQKD